MLTKLKGRWDVLIGAIGTVAFSIIALFDVGMDFNLVEVAGFITGAWAVWLVAKNSVWTWPVGIVNGAIFVWLFIEYDLFADAGINSWYVVAGIYGWLFWLYGGKNHTERAILHVPWKELVIVLAAVAVITWWMTGHLEAIGDAAPFLDALTATASFAAFWLQARRYIECWYIWIAADFVYIPLYFSRDLPVTGVLYIIFLFMCFYGVWKWWKEYRNDQRVELLDQHSFIPARAM